MYLFSTVPLFPPMHIVVMIASIGMLLTSMETLAARRLFADDGLLSWTVGRTQGSWGLIGMTAGLSNFFLGYSRYLTLLVIRVLASLLLLLLAANQVTIPFIVLLSFLISFGINLRSPFGLDGAYQMTLIILGAVSVFVVFGSNQTVGQLCIAFIGVQATISYCVSGYWKLVSPAWRNGTGIVGIFSTAMYGHKGIFRLLRNRKMLSLFASWSVITWELTFPLALVDDRVMYFYLAVGVLFHVSTGVFMGLNGFVFAFIATYPAIIELQKMVWSVFEVSSQAM